MKFSPGLPTLRFLSYICIKFKFKPMSEKEIRIKCMELSVSILDWYKGLTPMPHYNPIELAEHIYRYVTEGEVMSGIIWGHKKPSLPI